ncbi:hypothetical protein AVDCRST_MAG84-3248, partial [uncultured Microcoleus sp.]
KNCTRDFTRKFILGKFKLPSCCSTNLKI